jgi:hypothetical protein
MLNENQAFYLTNAIGHRLGKVHIQRVEENLVLGRIENGPDFHIYSKLFREHELAVNQQLFSIVDELERTIDAYGWYIYLNESNERLEVYDIQVMNECDLSLRVRRQSQTP